MTTQSKLIANNCDCKDFLHPWTSSCANASAGFILGSMRNTIRTYVYFYTLTLIMKRRIPTLQDLKIYLKSIWQSSLFLATNAWGFAFISCQLRRLLGRFYLPTAVFIPTFFSSLISIAMERPSRRIPLTLYVANLGTETLWEMMVARGWVRSLPNGQILIFGLSISALLYLYRLGVGEQTLKDNSFKVLRLLLGKAEEGPIKSQPETEPATKRPIKFASFIKGKHETCAHAQSCAKYAISGGIRSFLGGLGIQVGLKLLVNITKIVRMRMDWRKQIFNSGTLQFGFFLGSFSFLFKSISCSLRHCFGRDDAIFAIPAALIASISFTRFPNKTVALYVMWKALELVYKYGISLGLVPSVPHFEMFLYSFFTALLVHGSILEANTIRPSYYKFLQTHSADRISRFGVSSLAHFGLNSYEQQQEACKRMNIDTKGLPLCALAD